MDNNMDADNLIFFVVCITYIIGWVCLEIHEWLGNTD